MWVTVPKHIMFGHELFQEIVRRLLSCILVYKWVNISPHFDYCIAWCGKNTVAIKTNNIALQDITRACLLCGLKPGPNPGNVNLAMMHMFLLAELLNMSCAAILLQTKLFGVESTVPHHRHHTFVKSSVCHIPGFWKEGRKGEQFYLTCRKYLFDWN